MISSIGVVEDLGPVQVVVGLQPVAGVVGTGRVDEALLHAQQLDAAGTGRGPDRVDPERAASGARRREPASAARRSRAQVRVDHRRGEDVEPADRGRVVVARRSCRRRRRRRRTRSSRPRPGGSTPATTSGSGSAVCRARTAAAAWRSRLAPAGAGSHRSLDPGDHARRASPAGDAASAGTRRPISTNPPGRPPAGGRRRRTRRRRGAAAGCERPHEVPRGERRVDHHAVHDVDREASRARRGGTTRTAPIAPPGRDRPRASAERRCRRASTGSIGWCGDLASATGGRRPRRADRDGRRRRAISARPGAVVISTDAQG